MMRVDVLVVLAVFLSLAAASHAPAQERASFFQRYAPADPAAFEREIAEVRAELAQLRAHGREREALRSAADLGGMLVSARQEGEAKTLLESTVRQARALHASDAEGWATLYLATANQYLGASTDALHQFGQALRLAAAARNPELEHYTYHHRGRLKAELRDLDGARADFERALAIRTRLGDQERANSTQRALRALDDEDFLQLKNRR